MIQRRNFLKSSVTEDFRVAGNVLYTAASQDGAIWITSAGKGEPDVELVGARRESVMWQAVWLRAALVRSENRYDEA